MTGFGSSTVDRDGVHLSVEIKSVNNRYLKLSARLPDAVARFESEVEKLVRARVARGTVQMSVRLRFPGGQSGYRIDTEVLNSYQQQLLAMDEGRSDISLASLLQLPGVVAEAELPEELVNSVWPIAEEAIIRALEHFHDFREREGESMRIDLQKQCDAIASHLSEIIAVAPQVISDYRDKLLERVRRLTNDASISVSPNDVIREVALFADRCDINEETTRLSSHMDQFRRMLDGETSQGRKLEFIGQEMFREINTIGSKANSVDVAHCVVEMKASIERIREVLQNVE
ncbi:MAG: YicC family protein [Planctomycetaceae bacterium]|nr:YicC family protein [Planctomycetaceae bacterium]